MTTLKVISDLHLEFWDEDALINTIPNDCDIFIIPGDLTVSQKLVGALTKIVKRFPQIIYVPGNHDYYNSDFKQIDKELKQFAKLNSNFHYLNNKVLELFGQRFVGTTLWYPETLQVHYRKDCFTDFIYIGYSDPGIFERHKKAVNFLMRNLKEGDICISHHMPSQQCILQKFIGNPLNDFFAVDLNQLILKKQPKYWFYGHGHDANNFYIGKTQLINNPVGYPREQTSVDVNLLIKI